MNFIRKIVQSHSKEDVALHNELKKLLNFSPRKINKYKKAFTHRSVQIVDNKGNPINYERLEFLGDSILGSVINRIPFFIRHLNRSVGKSLFVFIYFSWRKI